MFLPKYSCTVKLTVVQRLNNENFENGNCFKTAGTEVDPIRLYFQANTA